MSVDPPTADDRVHVRRWETIALRVLLTLVGVGLGALAAHFGGITDWLYARLFLAAGGLLGWTLGRFLRP